VTDRWTRAVRILRREGYPGVAGRLLREANQRWSRYLPTLPLRKEDVAEAGIPPPVLPSRTGPGQRLRVGWLMTPPGIGSGGHTTMFRMVGALEEAGHECVVLLYSPNGVDVSSRREIVRTGWPWVRADVRSVDDGFDGLDACVATAWQTAHVLAARGHRALHRLYFVQDFEPYFYPRGSEYALAEESYRLGLTTIALGEMVADVLEAEVGVQAQRVPFGCDTDVYHLVSGQPPRRGVVFYAKPDVPRRGYLLNRLALERFHELRPEEEIHVYGHHPGPVGFPFTWHGRLTPSELNLLYNRTVAGLAMSFTNISLVAEEMLAAGLTPVVNDSSYTRSDLDNPHVAWTRPTPGAVAEALCQAVDRADPARHAALAAASVRRGWGPAQQAVMDVIEAEVYRGRRTADSTR